MIMLLEREQGVTSGRTTRDLDAIIDVRAIAGGSRTAASRLTGAGFEPSAEHQHRFIQGGDEVDLLAPDHLGSRTDLTTVPPMTTVAIPGGSRTGRIGPCPRARAAPDRSSGSSGGRSRSVPCELDGRAGYASNSRIVRAMPNGGPNGSAKPIQHANSNGRST
jgi:hypothetical protein